MAMIASHLSIGNSSTGATCWMPALLHEDVDGAELLLGVARPSPRSRRASPCRRANSAPRRRGVASMPRADRLDLLAVAEAVEDDVGALAGQRRGEAEADARGRAGDQRGLALQHVVRLLVESVPGSLYIASQQAGARGGGVSPLPAARMLESARDESARPRWHDQSAPSSNTATTTTRAAPRDALAPCRGDLRARGPALHAAAPAGAGGAARPATCRPPPTT